MLRLHVITQRAGNLTYPSGKINYWLINLYGDVNN